MRYYNGSRNQSLKFYAGICFTADAGAASAYGDHVTAVDIDRDKLNIQVVKMTDDELQAALDENSWPCDRESEIEAAIAAGFNAVAYEDCNEYGDTHDCLRILTPDAFTAAVAVVQETEFKVHFETSTREYIGAIVTDSLDSIREGIEVNAEHPSIPAGIPCIILSKPEPAYYQGRKVGYTCYARKS